MDSLLSAAVNPKIVKSHLCALNGTPHCIAFKKQGLIKYLIACLFTVLQGTDYYLIKPIGQKTQFGPVQNRFGPTEGQGNTQ